MSPVYRAPSLEKNERESTRLASYSRAGAAFLCRRIDARAGVKLFFTSSDKGDKLKPLALTMRC